MKASEYERRSWGAAGKVAPKPEPKRVRRYGPLLDDIPEDELTPADEYADRVAALRLAMHD